MNIPEDVMKSARAAYEKPLSEGGQSLVSVINRMDEDNVKLALALAIMAERERSQWQPIGQVNPNDGLILVGWGEYRERDGFSPAFMRWYESVGGWTVNGMPFYPTHCMPLPKPPEAS